VNNKRPINLNLFAFRFPVTSISSILHRVTGVLLFVAIPVVLCVLQMSLTSDGFAEVKSYFANDLIKLAIWLVLSSVAYHIIAGVRHLLMDAGIGETLEGGRFGSYAVIVLGVISAVLLGVYIW